MKKPFRIAKNDIMEATLKLDDKLIADLFNKGFRSIEEVCMRLRHQVHQANKREGVLTYTIINVSKGTNKTIKREVRNTSLMI